MSLKIAWTTVDTTAESADPDDGQIVEVAMYIADLDPFNFLGAAMLAIEPAGDVDKLLHDLSPTLSERYDKSGLAYQLKIGTHNKLANAETSFLEMLDDYGGPLEYILGGRVLHMQTPWLEKYMPTLYQWFAPNFQLDLEPLSFIIAQSKLSDELEPVYEQPNPGRAIARCERNCAEFDYYCRMIETIPLLPEES